jgi:hypothetical protein
VSQLPKKISEWATSTGHQVRKAQYLSEHEHHLSCSYCVKAFCLKGELKGSSEQEQQKGHYDWKLVKSAAVLFIAT